MSWLGSRSSPRRSRRETPDLTRARPRPSAPRLREASLGRSDELRRNVRRLPGALQDRPPPSVPAGKRRSSPRDLVQRRRMRARVHRWPNPTGRPRRERRCDHRRLSRPGLARGDHTPRQYLHRATGSGGGSGRGPASRVTGVPRPKSISEHLGELSGSRARNRDHRARRLPANAILISKLRWWHA